MEKKRFSTRGEGGISFHVTQIVIDVSHRILASLIIHITYLIIMNNIIILNRSKIGEGGDPAVFHITVIREINV